MSTISIVPTAEQSALVRTAGTALFRHGLVHAYGLVELDADGNRRELIFADDYELLGYQLTLLNPDRDYAPRGTLISWTAYLARQWAEQLPPDAPAIPEHD